MAKKYNVGIPGMVAVAIVGSVLLKHTDELGDNTSSAGGFAADLICIGQDLTGGMIQMPICVEGDQPAATDPASGQGD